jgi:hypothetical protein
MLGFCVMVGNTISAYRAVNTLRPGYKNESVNVV